MPPPHAGLESRSACHSSVGNGYVGAAVVACEERCATRHAACKRARACTRRRWDSKASAARGGEPLQGPPLEGVIGRTGVGTGHGNTMPLLLSWHVPL
eukprot:7383032-Prymnesium_polylepis.2